MSRARFVADLGGGLTGPVAAGVFGPVTDVASAATCDIGAAATTEVRITGTTSITSLGTGANKLRLVYFSGALTLTHNATTLFLPMAGANVTTAAGDNAIFQSDASGNWRCLAYQKADGTALVGATPETDGSTDVASAATCDIVTGITTKRVRITGTTTITSFGAVANRIRWVLFAGALTLTHNGTSLVLPGALDIVTAAGDTALFVSDGSGNWRCFSYTKADGSVAQTSLSTIASATTTNLGAVLSASITVSGTTTITSFGNAAPGGTVKHVHFSGALTLTHNGTSLILPGAANIVTSAGDCLLVRHEGSGNWRVLTYLRAAGRPLNTAASDTITKGFYVAPNNIGTVSSGTVTPDAANGNYQYYTNNGAHTLAAPSSDCAIDILITNGASAGAITFSGFTVSSSTGDALTTTNTSKFLVSIRRINSVSTYTIKAYQ